MESRRKMLATVVFVTTLFTSSVATSGPSGYPGAQSYGAYNQQQQQYQPQQQQQQQGQWQTEASYQKYGGSSQDQTQTEGSAPAVAEPETAAPSKDVEPAPLPEGWSEHFDPNSGQYYYYNAADSTTSWDRPSAPDVAEPVAVVVKGDDSRPLEQKPESIEVADVAYKATPEQEPQSSPENLVASGNSDMAEKHGIPDSSPGVESWQSNQHSPQMNHQQPGPNEPGTHGLPGQTDHRPAKEWGATQPIPQQHPEQPQQPEGGQSISTESSFVGGEPEAQKYEYQGQQPPQHQNEKTSGWGLSPKASIEDRPSETAQPWGVASSPEQQQEPSHPADPRNQQQQQQTSEPPRKEMPEQPPSAGSSGPPGYDNNWGAPKTPSSPYTQQQGSEQFRGQGAQKPPEAQHRPPMEQGPPGATRPPLQQQRSPMEQGPPGVNQPPPQQQRPPMEQGPPGVNQPPPQQQQPPARPQYMQRQYPPQPYGNYNPSGQPGQGQYGGQSSYGRGYPPPPQQSHPANTGQMMTQGTEAGTTAVKEALSTTWKGLLGFGNRTRGVVGTARDQVVTGATAAGQTLSARSSSMWEQAKSTVGGVFENGESGPPQPYSLGGQPTLDNRPPPGYQGRPTGPNQGYPGSPGSPTGRGPPPPSSAGGPQQQPGRYGPPFGQQPPPGYGGQPNRGPGGPPGRQRSPPSQQQPPQQQMKPPGYPGMQPRRDQAYPPTQNSPYRGPMQSQYGNQPGSQSPAQGGGYPPNQQRPPFSGPPGQPNRGPGTEQKPPQQKQQPEAWNHPGLTGEF